MRPRLGTHLPAMALVEVKSLVDQQAVVEVEATAVLSYERALPGAKSVSCRVPPLGCASVRNQPRGGP